MNLHRLATYNHTFAVLCCATHWSMSCCAVLCYSQPPLKGGGITIEGPEEDRADGSSDRGFLESLNIVLNNTLIQGNMAVEGGGVWSAWPMLLVNTTIRDNRAERAVSMQYSIVF